ncbi:hypothetical protein RvY_00742 [Ramazzottius varieornatus]|uniref:Uncharacterized protein n=1 Tax=Ramazzottius varieornatus TaxID=947166 RepID=A0A1D1UHV6_RAMVA|nr:hypothetical protein RvY_00742 [Ramazzottius varieornatus]
MTMYTSGPDSRVPASNVPTQSLQSNVNSVQPAYNAQMGPSVMPNMPSAGHRQSVAGLFNSKMLRRRLPPQSDNSMNNQMRTFINPPQVVSAPPQTDFVPFTSTPPSSFKSIHLPPPVRQQGPAFGETSLPGGDLLTRNKLLFSQPQSQRTRPSFADADQDQENFRRVAVNDKRVPTMSPAIQAAPAATPFPFHQSAVPTEIFVPTIPARFTQNLPSNFQLMSEPQQLDSFDRRPQNVNPPLNSNSPNIISQIFDPQNRNDQFASSFNPQVDKPSERRFPQDFNPTSRNFPPDNGSPDYTRQPFDQQSQANTQPDARMGDWVLPTFDSNFIPTEAPSGLSRQLSVHSDFMNTWIPLTDPDPVETTTSVSQRSHDQDEEVSSSTSRYFTVSHQDELGQVPQSVQFDDDYQPTSGMFRLFTGSVFKPIDTRLNQMNGPSPARTQPQTEPSFTGPTEGVPQQDSGLFQRLQFAHSNSSENDFQSETNTNY